jgi:hypothetical protein
MRGVRDRGSPLGEPDEPLNTAQWRECRQLVRTEVRARRLEHAKVKVQIRKRDRRVPSLAEIPSWLYRTSEEKIVIALRMLGSRQPAS